MCVAIAVISASYQAAIPGTSLMSCACPEGYALEAGRRRNTNLRAGELPPPRRETNRTYSGPPCPWGLVRVPNSPCGWRGPFCLYQFARKRLRKVHVPFVECPLLLFLFQRHRGCVYFPGDATCAQMNISSFLKHVRNNVDGLCVRAARRAGAVMPPLPG
jgi:hypothetical protein